MRWIPFAVIAVASCAAAEEGVEQGPDAGTRQDAAPPDGGDGSCKSAISNIAGVFRGHVGGTGGGKGPPLACEDISDERIVGVAVRMSNQTTLNGGRSAHGLEIACANVTIGADGTPVVGPIRMREVNGSGANSWSPSTSTAVTECKPGWVVSGVRAHTGTNQNRFIDVSIVCSQLGSDGAPGTSEVRRVVGSLIDPVNPKESRCAAGQVVAQLGTWIGSGLDAVDLYCAAPSCR
ncbi:MAG: hypothetical protein H0T89_21705 [Deltaproteobacteria bacterium]|nr:hypothetical protein [Deltaproteobacteria bacterium]MDQ3296807.1 hypothetical protein [Myxococcota bacterium]